MMSMKPFFAMTLLVGLSLPAVATASDRDQATEKDEMTLEQLPKAARTAIEQEVGDGRIEEIERDKRRGKTVYEVEYSRADGTEMEFDVTPEGKISDRHEE